MHTHDVCLRSADHADVPALHALLQRAYRGISATRSWSHEGEIAAGERITFEALDSLVEDPAAMLSVAGRGAELIGSSLVRPGVGGHEISLLSVDPKTQGCGLGDLLLQHAERQARQLGSRAVTLHVLEHNARLIGYYERRAYRKTGASCPYPHRLSQPARLLTLRKELV